LHRLATVHPDRETMNIRQPCQRRPTT